MADFDVRVETYKERVLASFAKQSFLCTLGAQVTHIAPGEVDITLHAKEGLEQQHGFFHAGVTTTIMDSAAGYAAFSLFGAGDGVLTSELKVNLLNPARGAFLLAKGRVIKPGKMLTICQGDVYGALDGKDIHIATGLFTMVRAKGLEP
ncbi:MAG: PaaI family thioesterase [Cohaesibacter sp.]|nr:PaaI family thioesterase [Cohaesibacter sp.]